LLNATLFVAACARGGSAVTADATADAEAVDAPRHVDAFFRTPDAAPDAGCAISEGMTLALDGNGDEAKYPNGQHVALGAMMGGDDAAIAWDRQQLYITVTSPAFTGAYEPLHVYIETGTGLGTPVPSQGKEYSGLVPQLAFTPTYLLAARRVSDSGTGAYNAVYTPAATWTTVAMPLAAAVSSDMQTLSLTVPWSALGGCPTHMRLAAHVVHAQSGNEWKDLAPSTHTPWLAPGGGYYEIDLTGSTPIAGWSLR
jgi:hypothetical protein